MVRVLLQVLKVVKASLLFHDQCECVFIVSVQVVLCAISQCVVKSFKGHGQHSNIVDLKYVSKSFDETFINKLTELHWVCLSCAVAQSPHCFILYLHVVMQQNIHKLVDDARIKTSLDLLLRTSSDV